MQIKCGYYVQKNTLRLRVSCQGSRPSPPVRSCTLGLAGGLESKCSLRLREQLGALESLVCGFGGLECAWPAAHALPLSMKSGASSPSAPGVPLLFSSLLPAAPQPTAGSLTPTAHGVQTVRAPEGVSGSGNVGRGPQTTVTPPRREPSPQHSSFWAAVTAPTLPPSGLGTATALLVLATATAVPRTLPTFSKHPFVRLSSVTISRCCSVSYWGLPARAVV